MSVGVKTAGGVRPAAEMRRELSDSGMITRPTEKALPSSENNAGLPGSMANRIEKNKEGLERKQQFYPSLKSLGITSTFLPDIMAAMPKNSLFRSNVNGTGIYDNPENRIPFDAGVITIEKTESYHRVLFTQNKSGGANGQIFLASVDTNTKTVNGWYVFEGRLLD